MTAAPGPQQPDEVPVGQWEDYETGAGDEQGPCEPDAAGWCERHLHTPAAPSAQPDHPSNPDQLMARALGVCWHSPTSDRWPCTPARAAAAPAVPTDVVDQVAQAMCRADAVNKGRSFDEAVAPGIALWMRYRYEAEQLVGELPWLRTAALLAVPSRLSRSTTRGEQSTDGGGDGGREVLTCPRCLLTGDHHHFAETTRRLAAEPETLRDDLALPADVEIRELRRLLSELSEAAAHFAADDSPLLAKVTEARAWMPTAALLAEQPGVTRRPSDRCTCRDTFLHHNDREHGGCIECPCPEFVLAEQPGGGK